ncbi:Plasmodium exported protein (PHISTb), unknown function [Plasmodium sp. gorilla clade G2]|uniref:Plasmodium exported protein (PHISTb), unknown function n=1 Tax=Plasmodium sp. gorilla clade G2 TaxID=880535 RepID=UPI000D2D497F|nr:Plasmodium exported protein (PHISTb), unknown function [Plasmodium sp. gorilla clade G2]SOV20093.1 Plasmodium exported protein (PHISTb), unknown function [Plasmodium sp. gorilla clade G2]
MKGMNFFRRISLLFIGILYVFVLINVYKDDTFSVIYKLDKYSRNISEKEQLVEIPGEYFNGKSNVLEMSMNNKVYGKYNFDDLIYSLNTYDILKIIFPAHIFDKIYYEMKDCEDNLNIYDLCDNIRDGNIFYLSPKKCCKGEKHKAKCINKDIPILVMDPKDLEINKKIRSCAFFLNRKKYMKDMWSELMFKEKLNLFFLIKHIEIFYKNLKVDYNIENNYVFRKFCDCKKMIVMDILKSDYYLNVVFSKWIKNSKLKTKEFKMLLKSCRYCWRYLKRKLHDSCEEILINSFNKIDYSHKTINKNTNVFIDESKAQLKNTQNKNYKPISNKKEDISDNIGKNNYEICLINAPYIDED